MSIEQTATDINRFLKIFTFSPSKQELVRFAESAQPPTAGGKRKFTARVGFSARRSGALSISFIITLKNGKVNVYEKMSKKETVDQNGLFLLLICVLCLDHILDFHQPRQPRALVFFQFHGNIADGFLQIGNEHVLQRVDAPACSVRSPRRACAGSFPVPRAATSLSSTSPASSTA